MWALRGCRSWSRWGQGAALLLLLLGVPPRGLALPPLRYSHAGICPNDMNPNLWVDAHSTCKRECETDQVSVNPEARARPAVLVVRQGGSWVVRTTQNVKEPGPGPHGHEQGVMS